MKIESFDITDCEGSEILSKLEELVKGPNWNNDFVFDFIVHSKVFSISPNPKPNQPRNGYVNFPEFSSRWKADLQPCLKSGFKQTYDQLLDETFLSNWDLLETKSFGCFILLQFEIARRVKGEPDHIPSQAMIKDGIRIALYFDKEEKYKTMTDMFCGENRKEAYKKLKCDWESDQQLNLASLMASLGIQ